MAWPREFSNLRPLARIKTRKNYDFSWPADPKTGGPKREPKWIPKWAQKWPRNGALFGHPKSSKKHCNSLCFHSKRGPEGAPFLAQKWARKWTENDLKFREILAKIWHFEGIFEPIRASNHSFDQIFFRCSFFLELWQIIRKDCLEEFLSFATFCWRLGL